MTVLNSLSSLPFFLVNLLCFLSLIRTCFILITRPPLTLPHLSFFPFVSLSFLLLLTHLHLPFLLFISPVSFFTHLIPYTLHYSFFLPLPLFSSRWHLLLNFSSLNLSPSCLTSPRQASEAKGDPTYPTQSSHSTFVVFL